MTRTAPSSSRSNRPRRSPAGSWILTVTRSRGRPSDPTSNRAGITPWVCPRSRLAVTEIHRAQRADRMRLFAGGRERGNDHPAAVRSQGCRRPAGRDHGRRRHPIEGLTRRGSFPRGADSDEPIAMVSRIVPSPSAPWDLARAWTLRRRAGFAATWDELQRDLDERPRCGGGPGPRRHRPHSGHARRNSPATADLLGDAAASGGDIRRLQAWWLFRMLFTPDPADRTADARLARPLRDQPAQGRRRRGDARPERDVPPPRPRAVRRSAAAMLRDPALLVWLDAPSNRKGKPNENLARELMELFTLGVGQFSEARRQGGRAGPDRPDGRPGPICTSARTGTTMATKTILGKTDRFDGDKVADLLLRHPATARRLAWRLCQTFLGEDVADESAVVGAGRATASRRPARRAGRRDDPPLGAVLLRAEPARAGLGPGRLRHRHGAEPRTLRPAAEHAVARRVDRPPGPGAVLPAQRGRLARRSKLAVGPLGGRAGQLRGGPGRWPLERRIHCRCPRPPQPGRTPRAREGRRRRLALLRRPRCWAARSKRPPAGRPSKIARSEGGSDAERFNRAVALSLATGSPVD